MIAFAVDPQLSATVIAAERRLKRALSMVGTDAEDAALRALGSFDPVAALGQYAPPAALVRRVAADLALVARLGSAHAAHEMHRAARRRAVRFAGNIADEDASLYLAYARESVFKIGADVYAERRAIIADCLGRGMPDAEIGEVLRLDAGEKDRKIFARYARTETTRFYTLGRTEAIEAAGDAVWGYEYVVIEDSRTSEICEALIGKRVPKGEMRHFPPMHWNCRTTVIAVMAEWVTGDDPTAGDLLTDAPKPEAGYGQDPRAQIASIRRS